MGIANLPTNLDTTYADDPTRPDIKLHQQHSDTSNGLVNVGDVVLRWNATTRQWDPRPPSLTGFAGIEARSTHDPTATAPELQASTGWIVGDVWEWHPDGGPA